MTIGKIKCAESASVYPGFFKVQVQHFNDVERHIVNFIDKIYFCERNNFLLYSTDEKLFKSNFKSE